MRIHDRALYGDECPTAVMNIFLFRPLSSPTIDRLRHDYPQCEFFQTTDAALLESQIDRAEVLFGNAPASLLAKAPRLRWVQIVSSGFDEYAALDRTGVTLTTAHGVHAPFLAEHILMSMLMFARGQLRFEKCRQERRWDRNPAIPFSLAGQTVGFVGLGSTARELLRFFPPLGLRAIAVRRTPSPTEGVDRVDGLDGLDRLILESDHLVLTLPLTRDTGNLIDSRRIGLMRQGAFLYNISRGGLVDETALLARLHSDTLGGAALDVFQQEPLPADSPWWTAPRSIITPHIAGHHRDLGMATLAVFEQNLQRFLDGQPLKNIANFNRGY